MAKNFFAAIQEELTKRASAYLSLLFGSSAAGGVYFFDPFYHPGWISAYVGWLGIPILVGVIAILVCHYLVGFVIVLITALLNAFAFAFLWRNPNYQYDNLPFLTWLSHLIFVALAVGIAVGLFKFLVQIRKPTSPSAPRTKRGETKKGRTSDKALPSKDAGTSQTSEG